MKREIREEIKGNLKSIETIKEYDIDKIQEIEKIHVFYYRVDKKYDIGTGNESCVCVKYKHLGDIDYEKWKNFTVRLDMAFETLGYDMNLQHDEILSNDELIVEANKRTSWFSPITEDEYNKYNEI